MAWNPAVFRTLDKLHSHSKWIYINKKADTWKRRERESKGDEATKDWGRKVWAKGGRTSTMDQEDKLWCRRGEREGCKVVNERGFSQVLRLYKVGSEGLTEVLWSTACDQYSSGFPHYWNRPHCVYRAMDLWDQTLLMCICQPGYVLLCVHNKVP